MNKKRVIITSSILIVLLGIGGGIAVYRYSRPPGSGQGPADFPPGTGRLTLSELSSRLDCPCGDCSLSLDDCACGTADEVRSQMSSLIMNGLSENAITDVMVRRYGGRILGRESRVPPYYEEVSGVDIPETLDPESVYPNARVAYEAARAYPELMMQLPCFCGCEVGRGTRKAHKSLLDCFVDRHGASCRTCIEEAVFARRGFEEGMGAEEIRRVIVKASGVPRG